MTETDSQPIAENEQVKELLALLKDNNTPGYEEFARLSESRLARQPISSVCISARLQKKRWRTKSSVCSVRKSAKCDFFLNLMKKSLTFRLWQNCEVDFDFLWCQTCTI